MNVRAKRDGVEEVFERDCVRRIMRDALTKRYASAVSADASSLIDTHDLQGTVASSQGLVPLEDYTLRPHSRTTQYVCGHSEPSPLTHATPESSQLSSSLSVTAPSAQSQDAAVVACMVAAECLRHRSFIALTQTDLRRVLRMRDAAASQPVSSQAGATVAAAAPPLATWQEFSELPPRWVMQSLGAIDGCSFESGDAWQVRRCVTPLDVGATVRKCVGETDEDGAPVPDSTAADAASRALPSRSFSTARGTAGPCAGHLYRVIRTAPMARGAFWVDVTPQDAPDTAVPDSASAALPVERVDREAVMLDPPAPLCVDPLLPCDELCSDRGVNTGIYVFFLRALQKQQGSGRPASAKRGREERGASEADVPAAAAAELAVEVSQCARRRRAELARLLQLLPWPAVASAHLDSTASTVDSTVRGGEGGGRAKDAGPSTSSAPLQVALQVRVDLSRGCLQLRAHVTKADDGSGGSGSSAQSSHECSHHDREADAPQRLRTDSSLFSVDGSAVPQTHAAAAAQQPTRVEALEVESPTVELLLRSAEKLAALYDMTHAAQTHHRRAGTHGETCSIAEPAKGMENKEEEETVAELKGQRGGTACAGERRDCRAAAAALEQLTQAARAEEEERPSTAALPACQRAVSAWQTVDLINGTVASARRAASLEPAGQTFLARLFIMLLRYRSLFGEHGYNQGPQAAVPPPIMEELATQFRISAEAFASPLNVQLPQFGSLFPDTDACFGSLGSFFDLVFTGGHVEVNPPFDTTLLRHMEAHLTACLTAAQEAPRSLLFLIVLPSHDLDAAEALAEPKPGAKVPALARYSRSDAPPSTDRALRESPFCLGHVLCAAAESAYVDGHQHLLESPFFTIGTPTRLILLGNGAARARFPSASAQLEAVRCLWRELTRSALKRQR